MKQSRIKLGSFKILIGRRAFSSSSWASQKKKEMKRKTEIRKGARKCASVQPSVVPPSVEQGDQ
jgi:hypothetical protein